MPMMDLSGRNGPVRSGSRRALFRRAVAAYEGGRLVEAEALCAATLEVRRSDFDALHLLGVVKSRRGMLVEAVSVFGQALEQQPDNADLHNNLGTVLADQGRFLDALKSYDRAIELKRDLASAHNNRGCVLMYLDRYDEALTSHGKALVLVPKSVEYINNLGRVLTRLQRYDEALDCYEDAIELNPNFVDALINRGATLNELKCFAEAAESFDCAMKAGGDKIDLLLRRANALTEAQRHDEALAGYDQAIVLKPERHDFLLGRSTILARLGRMDEAREGFDRALGFGVERASVLISRALALSKDGPTAETLADAEEAVRDCPDNPDAHNVLGLALMGLDRFEESVACYKSALALRPKSPIAEWNLGYVSLLLGDFAEGWRYYEARRRQEGMRWTRLDGPEWRGEPIAGKRILLYAEQGLGDTIHFARYVTFVADMGATVILGVQAPLAELLRGVVGDPEIIRHGDQTPPFHYHQSLMSVARLFEHDEKSIPSKPYLRADSTRVAFWKARLPEAPLRVGIAWQGSGAIEGRSIPLEQFAPLSAVPGVVLVSLQKNAGVEQLETLPPNMRVETLGEDFDAGPDAFLDTAAVMANLDLIVACDTSLAHLAGALGRPTWIVLKTVPDWRWLLHRTDSPWYPTARLFRREKSEAWADTMQKVGVALAELAAYDGAKLPYLEEKT